MVRVLPAFYVLQPVSHLFWARCLLEPSLDDPINASVYRMRVHFSPQVLTSPAQDLVAHAREIGSTTEVALCAYEKTVGCVRGAVLASLMKEA